MNEVFSPSLLPYQMGQMPFLLIFVGLVPFSSQYSSKPIPPSHQNQGAPHSLVPTNPAFRSSWVQPHVALCSMWYPSPLSREYLWLIINFIYQVLRVVCSVSPRSVNCSLPMGQKRYSIKTNISWHFCGLKLFFFLKKVKPFSKELGKVLLYRTASRYYCSYYYYYG